MPSGRLRSGWNHNSAYYPWITEHAYAVRGRELDIGCGAGLLLDRLSPICDDVTGIDPDPQAVADAEARTQRRRNVRVHLGSVLTADLPDAGFDLVTFVASLHHLDLAAGLRRGATLVAPGGRLLVVGLSRPAGPADWVVLGLTTPVVRLLDRGHGHDADDGRMVMADPRTSLAEIRRAAATITPGARIRRGLYHRYLLSWARPGPRA